MTVKSTTIKRKNIKDQTKLQEDKKLKSGNSETKNGLIKLNRIRCGSCLTYGGFIFAFLSLSFAVYMLCTLSKDEGAIGHPGHLAKERKSREIVDDKQQHANDLVWEIDKRSNLSLSEFIEKYDGKRPVIITDALTGWKANNWSKNFFVKNYGDQRVVMKAVHGTLNQAESLALPMKLFGEHSDKGSPRTWTYVQDELFIQLHPELREHLGQPIYLKEDFFQLFPSEVRPWNAMLLWGTAYSRSYLHIDPYNWTGTNAVFSGKKLWKLYPPGQDHYLYVYPGTLSEFPLNCFKYNSPIDAFKPDFEKYPLFKKARSISVVQKPGELLIIPPGWFHQAFNEIETIAVSSQVMNSQNYHIILEEIFKAGNIDRNILTSDFKKLSPVDQVFVVVNSLSPKVIERGRAVTSDILKQMGYSTTNTEHEKYVESLK